MPSPRRKFTLGLTFLLLFVAAMAWSDAKKLLYWGTDNVFHTVSDANYAASDHNHSGVYDPAGTAASYVPAQFSGGVATYLDGSNNNIDVNTRSMDWTDLEQYPVVTGKADNQDGEIVYCWPVPLVKTSFAASGAFTVDYKLSDGTGNNGVKLIVRGTDGVECYTGNSGTATSKATLTVAASALSSCVKTAGAMICASARVTVDNNDTASIGNFTFGKME